jgi:hypothetical protein
VTTATTAPLRATIDTFLAAVTTAAAQVRSPEHTVRLRDRLL